MRFKVGQRIIDLQQAERHDIVEVLKNTIAMSHNGHIQWYVKTIIEQAISSGNYELLNEGAFDTRFPFL